MNSAHGNVLIKLLAWTLAAGVIALPLVGALNGWFAASRWPLRQLKIDAALERVSVEQLQSAVAGQVHGGFFAVDLQAVRHAVEQIPWVDRVQVRRRWPDVLQLQVLERTAAAVWTDQRLVDAEGRLFDAPLTTIPDGLPLLSGPQASVSDLLARLREFDVLMRASGLSLTALTLSGRGSWSLRTASGAEIVLGREHLRDRLQRFLDALRRVDASSGLVLVRADLRYANGFAVQWQQAARTPAPTPNPNSAPQA